MKKFVVAATVLALSGAATEVRREVRSRSHHRQGAAVTAKANVADA